jgi:hypothetical protein
MLLGLALKLPNGFLKLALGTVIGMVVWLVPLFGSFLVVDDVVQLADFHVDRSIIGICLIILWVTVTFPLLWFARRIAALARR